MGAVAGYAATGGPIPLTFSAGGILLMAVGLGFGRSQPVLWAVGVVAAAYVGSLYLRGAGFDPWSVPVGVTLLASSELAHWSNDSRVRSLDEIRVHTSRALAIIVVLAIVLAFAAIVEGAADLGSRGIAAAIVATAALLSGLVGLTAVASRRAQ